MKDEAGKVLETGGDAKGKVTFSTISEDDLGKTFNYTVEEKELIQQLLMTI
ncbi:MAG: hypothetical protein ACLTOX_05580 [Streptococcus thermophilus]